MAWISQGRVLGELAVVIYGNDIMELVTVTSSSKTLESKNLCEQKRARGRVITVLNFRISEKVYETSWFFFKDSTSRKIKVRLSVSQAWTANLSGLEKTSS